MSDNSRDRELGMHRKITRRDFLDGIAVTVGSSILASTPWLRGLAATDSSFAPEKDPSYYPPALMGMRGNHEGSYTSAHSLRDGEFWDSAGKPESTGEKYDLVVVGGGISGLAAAYFYRQHAGANARILILDNHDDFGGHAKRNEFRSGNRMLLEVS
jgi:spermidine dehydrogenase